MIVVPSRVIVVDIFYRRDIVIFAQKWARPLTGKSTIYSGR